MVELLGQDLSVCWDENNDFIVGKVIRDEIERHYKYSSCRNTKEKILIEEKCNTIQLKRKWDERHLKMQFFDDIQQSLGELNFVLAMHKLSK
mmetsp:Transcript_9906/g.14015  ORF Transcript_9906/g.14015 Transcript_9906/m.14015 type:complete len:92 (-) Transcript_9906:7-282(-)